MDILAVSDPFLKALIENDFLQRALFTGLLIGFVTPLIGSFVVIKRLSFIADTLSHFSLAGLSIGTYLITVIGFVWIADELYLAMIFSIIGAFIIEILRGYYQNYKEISMPIVMSMGTALSGLFISLSGGISLKLYNYLFGTILTVDDSFLRLITVATVVVVLLLVIFYKQMVMISFDETYAKLLGIKVRRFQFMSTLILAVVVSISLATVGVLLVSSLMIIPVASAMKVGKSFKNTISIAILFSELSVIGGLWISYEADLPTGATIVLCNVMILVIVGISRTILNGVRLRQDTKKSI